jgi:membrane protease YdiL (CAAX protease family)
MDRKTRLAHIGLGAAWLVGLSAALQLVEMLLGKSPLASAMAGAVLADVVAGFAGVRWDSQKAKGAAGAKKAAEEPAPAGKPAAAAAAEEEAPTSGARPAPGRGEAENGRAGGEEEPSPVRRAGIGMATSLVAVIVTLLFGAVLGWVDIDRGGPSPSMLFALLRSSAIGVRDELLLRGIVLTAAARAGVSPRVAALVAALAGGASLALIPSVSPGAIALAITSGFFFALLWQRFRGAWAAVAAHAFWTFLIGSALRGGVIDVAWSSGSLTAGGRSTGGAAWLAAVVFAGLSVAAVVLERRRAAR